MDVRRDFPGLFRHLKKQEIYYIYIQVVMQH